ncbi:MAG: GGDEF domain-containing protein, partial [Huintestinicola sp.]
TAEKKIFENLSTYDPLTKILNRRAFEKASAKYFETEHEPECSLIFFDVDYFKQVNDNYGHEVGDFILVSFAASLNSVFGDSGLVSRFGGDEFVVLIRNGSKEAVTAMVEHLSEKIKALRIECDEDFRLQFSAGLAACPYDTDNLEELMKCADKALYRVKEAGRNGWQWFS